ncbi:MAG: hypothetical protein ABFS38_05915, partial [Bacteroidota bacterium]
KYLKNVFAAPYLETLHLNIKALQCIRCPTRKTAKEEMAAVAMYAALLDGNCHTLILKDPPATQDAPGRPDGQGAAIEMLNCLRITDLGQLPA